MNILFEALVSPDMHFLRLRGLTSDVAKLPKNKIQQFLIRPKGINKNHPIEVAFTKP